MSNLVRWGLSAALGIVVACGSGSADGARDAIEDPVQFDASSETRAELGIERWGATGDAREGETILHGYGANHRQVVELRHRVGQVDDAHRTVEFSVRGAHGAAEMRVELEVRPVDPAVSMSEDEVPVLMRVTANTFPSATDSVRRVLARAEDDARSARPEAPNQGSSLVTKTRPLANGEEDKQLIEKYCQVLVQSCGQFLLLIQKRALQTSLDCHELKAATEAALLCKKKAGFLDFGAEKSCRAANDVPSKEKACALAATRDVEEAEKNYDQCRDLRTHSQLDDFKDTCRPADARPK